MKLLKRGTAAFLSLLMVLLSFNFSAFTASAAEEGVGINESGAVPGTALTLSYVETSSENTQYIWYVDGKKIDCTANTYTPTEADLEKFIKVEIYNGETLVAQDERFCSKLPVVYINTSDGLGITSKEDYVQSSVKITGTKAESKAEYDGAAQTKGHGNSTWQRYPKKSYKLKLDKKTDLFGMGKNKNWVLLANYIDESVMRNMSSTELARIYGAETNNAVWVDVVLNGKCIGNYTLFEQTKIGSTRVDIFDWEDAAGEIANAVVKKEKLSDDDENAIKDMLEQDLSWMTSGRFTYAEKEYTIADYYDKLPDSVNGGYLMELDNNFDEISKFHTTHGQPIMFKNPEFLNTNQNAFLTIQNYIQDFEDALYSDSKYIVKKGKKVSYTDLCDMDSFVTYFLASETLISEYGYRSTYFSKDVDDVIKFGPVWDFDFSSGCVNPYGNYYGVLDEDHWSRNDYGNWFGVAMKDPYFAVSAQELFMSKINELKDMVKDGGTLDTWYVNVKESALNNSSIWPYAKGFEEDFKNFKAWFIKRLSWMEKQFATESTALKSFGINLAEDIALKANGANKVGDIVYTVPASSGSVEFTTQFDQNSGFTDYEYYINGEPCGVFPIKDGTSSFTVYSNELNSDGKDNVITIRATDKNGVAKMTCAVLRITDESLRKITFIDGENKNVFTVQDGKSFTLPEQNEHSVIFGGWSDGTNIVDGGKVLTADADMTYTAIYVPCTDGSINHTFEEKDGKLVCTDCQKDKKSDKALIRISNCTFDLNNRYTTRYNGNPLRPSLTVYYGGRTLVENVDYTLTCYNNVNPGFAYYTIKGIESAGFTGEVSKSYGIIPTEITRLDPKFIKLDKTSYEYTGQPITPKLSLSYADNPLVEGRDYVLSYSNNTEIGTAAVTITGIGNFNSSRKVNFNITPISSGITAKLSQTSYTYDGKVKTPSVNVTDAAGNNLKSGTDYTVTYPSGRINSGKYYVKVSFLGKYTGEKTLAFEISKADISKANVSLKSGVTYTGKAITPAVTVKNGNITLKNGTDYTVSYKSNTNIGTATVTITGKGNYSGIKTATFKIVLAKPTNLKFTQTENTVKLTWNKATGADSYGVYVYDTKKGKYKSLATVTGTSCTVKNLKAGTTYKFAVRSNKKIGSTTFHSSNAVSTVTTKFIKVTSLKADQNTSAVKLTWGKVSGATGYDVYQKIGGKWKKVTTTKSTSYTVKKLKAGTVYNFAVRANRVVGKTTYNGAFTFITTATKTATPTMAVKAGSKKATVTWKKVSGATGYQIYMSTKKTSGYKKIATISASKTAKYTKTGLTKGKTYYVRVRTYKVVGKAKIYSGYQTKTVKIK